MCIPRHVLTKPTSKIPSTEYYDRATETSHKKYMHYLPIQSANPCSLLVNSGLCGQTSSSVHNADRAAAFFASFLLEPGGN